MKETKPVPAYGTFYNPDEGLCGHFCIHYEGENNHTLSGTRTLEELLSEFTSCPIWDISHVDKIIIGLNPENMLKRGAIKL